MNALWRDPKLVLKRLHSFLQWSTPLFLIAAGAQVHAATPAIQVPAFTAYTEPNPEAMEIAEKGPIRGWSDAKTALVWYGQVRSTGSLNVSVRVKVPRGQHSVLEMQVGDEVLPVKDVRGFWRTQTVFFGTVQVTHPMAYRFALTGTQRSGASYGAIGSLKLTGDAASKALFNLTPVKGAPSVHLNYPLPENVQAEWFYNEVTVKSDPLWSYYEACGFARGYFGIQVNSPTERRIIFSVWDSGRKAADRKKVATDNRVVLLEKGPGVFASDFGHEGTGGHSHLVYPWKTGDTYRFLVHAVPQGDTTVYTGYFYFPEKHAWGLIASFRAPKDGGYLRHLYSFNEDFNGANGQQKRLADFSNQFIRTTEGKWVELTQARFTHTAVGKYTDRLDRGAGVTADRFYLTNGGFKAEAIQYNDQISRPASAHPPDLLLPATSSIP